MLAQSINRSERFMEIKAVINDKYEEMELHVCNSEMNDAVAGMISNLTNLLGDNIPAKNNAGDSIFISQRDIISIYAEGPKVFIHTETGNYEASKKLYEFENELDETRFLRISKSEIVGLKKIKRLDLGMTGTIKVCMSDGYECYTSRRNVSNLKKALGL